MAATTWLLTWKSQLGICSHLQQAQKHIHLSTQMKGNEGLLFGHPEIPQELWRLQDSEWVNERMDGWLERRQNDRMTKHS